MRKIFSKGSKCTSEARAFTAWKSTSWTSRITGAELATSAKRSLLESGGRVLGVIVNDVDFKGGGNFKGYDYSRRYGYNQYGRYGRYGYGYGYYPRGISEDAEGAGNEADGDGEAAVEVATASVLDVDDDER